MYFENHYDTLNYIYIDFDLNIEVNLRHLKKFFFFEKKQEIKKLTLTWDLFNVSGINANHANGLVL